MPPKNVERKINGALQHPLYGCPLKVLCSEPMARPVLAVQTLPGCLLGPAPKQTFGSESEAALKLPCGQPCGQSSLESRKIHTSTGYSRTN